jgi:SAM-dependent methyltransferase
MRPCPICATSLDAPTIAAPDRLHGTRGTFEVAICPDCGAGVTLPDVTPADLQHLYPASYGTHVRPRHRVVRLISAAIQAWQGVLARRSAPLAALRGLRPGRGLDVGAGRGDLSAMLQVRGWTMSAIEPSEAAAEAARGRGIDARVGVLATVALEPGAFDMVVFRHSLEHTLDPVEDLRCVHAAMRPGGLLLVSVPNFGCWQRRRLGSSWYHLDVPRHRVHFTSGALARAFELAGFALQEITTSTSAVGVWATLQYRVFGRCIVPPGLAMRAAEGLCALGLPVALVLDRLGGGGDTLHAVGVKPVPSARANATSP